MEGDTEGRDHKIQDVNKVNEDLNIESKRAEDEVKDEEPEVEEILSEEVKTQKHNDALALKDGGNKQFKDAHYDDAINLYTEGLEICPKCFSKSVAVLFSNRAACYVKMGEKDSAITDCTSALDCDPYYTKARLRRANMYEATEKLEDALKDYNEILKYDKSCQLAGEAAMRLPGEINERNEKLKAEMLGKLKELGNMCLNPFGLSTDNFKVNQDPTTGGYSVNFQR